MEKAWNAPGSCADCGNGAYIRLSDEGSEAMLCAHCYAARTRAAKARREDERPRARGDARPQ